MKKDILLSFCVPTYNRPEPFKKLLTGIVPQLAEYKDEVEIVVRDDSTNDLSEAAANEIVNRAGISLNYYRGEKAGIDPANLFIAEHATGKFVWWCGDDDEIKPGAVKRIMEIIKTTPDLAFIFVNSYSEGSPQPAVANETDRFLKDHNEFLDVISIAMTLLSTGIFKREIGLRALPLARNYVGSAFASQPLILEAITSGGKLYLLNGPYIINRRTILKKTEELFYDGVETFGTTYYNLLKDFSDKFSKQAIRAYHKRNFGHIWRGLIIDWVRRDMPAPRNRLWEMRIYRTLPEFWLAVLIYMLPKTVVRSGLNIYKTIRTQGYDTIR